MSQPTSIHSHSVSRYLEIEWSDGVVSRFPHRFLRLHCRCAECLQSLNLGNLLQADEDLNLRAVIPYGPASVQFEFSDGHSRGIFPFPYLRELAAGAGLSTEPNLS